jgi:hypothetical protein
VNKPKTAVPPHPFVADPDVPPDHLGRGACRCGLIGLPDDAHHAMPDGGDDAQRRAAGERSDR